ncbi:Poly [Thraustotheca clavata]|uniref:poly(ADP-ribose) glycohydrolase n=1 Tax=Thraustotheca clavata TaxID=74557 RepID=A0A1V9ZZB5_9STRA|nr:Poly [Thraustotheca clavata]
MTRSSRQLNGEFSGRTFGAIGLEKEQLKTAIDLVASLGGQFVHDSKLRWQCKYLIVGYWYPIDVNTLQNTTCVTLYWLESIKEKGLLIEPQSNKYYLPPLPSKELLYPIEGYQEYSPETHIQLPCSSTNTKNNVPRWPYIVGLLSQPIPNIEALKRTIARTTQSDKNCQFENLTEAIKLLPFRSIFFSDIMPFVQQLALQLPFLLPSSAPLLRQKPSGYSSVTLSKAQVASVIFHGFFCTLPARDNNDYPQVINFDFFLQGATYAVKTQKLAGFLHYFSRLALDPSVLLTQFISFSRNSMDLSGIEEPLTTRIDPMSPVEAFTSGTIEEDDHALQVDFANMYAGGGVMRSGCVQEEIRFIINPECIMSCMLCEVLDHHESFIIHGAEQYCGYRGYDRSFAINDDFEDSTPFDQQGRRDTVIVGIDAICFYKNYRALPQFSIESILRELGKAAVGFAPLPNEVQMRPVATGNWGCGVFGGNIELKFILQWLAASLNRRQVHYFTFGDNRLREKLIRFVSFVQSSNMAIRDVAITLMNTMNGFNGNSVFDAFAQASNQ